ncbi:MAG: hypothetical protein R3C61_13375 [Bacteroidia bacterium]
MNRRTFTVILAILLVSTTPRANAQTGPSLETVTDWYMEQMFQAVDRDLNDQAVKGEMQPFARELGWFLDDGNFREADRDGSGGIDRKEMRLFMGEAQFFRSEQELLQLQVLLQKYPYFTDAKPQYFRRHPELATLLAGNRTWAREHTETLTKILSQKNIIDEEPELIGALHRNLTFLAEHATIATFFYSLKATAAFQPMDTWRNSHQNFIKNNAGIENQTYQIVFPRYERQKPLPPETPLAPPLADASPTARLSAPVTTPQPTAARPVIIDLGASDTPEKELPELQELKQSISQLKEEYAQKIRREKHRNDSLMEANSRYASQIRQLESRFQGLRDSAAKTAPAASEAQPKEAMVINDLERQIRYLKTEAVLARIEEDSLLAETIRQKKYILDLEKRLSETETKPEVIVQTKTITKTVPANCEEADRLTAKLTRLTAKNDSILALVDAMKNKQQLDQLKFNVAQEEAQRTRARLDSLTSGIAFHRSQVNVLETKIQEQDSRVWQYKLLARDKEEELIAQKQKLRELESQITRMDISKKAIILGFQIKRDSLVAEITKLETELDNTRQNLSNAETQLAKVRDEHAEQARAEAQKMQAYRQEIDEITYDNEKLRQQLELTLEHSAENENDLEQQILLAKTQSEQLLAQNDRLRRRKRGIPAGAEIITLTRELEEAESIIAELQLKNQSLKYQLTSSFSYLDKTVAQQQQLESEIRNQLSDIARLSSLRDSLNRSVKESYYTDWADSMKVYRQRLNIAEGKLVEYQLAAQKEKATARMVQDSLQSEILKAGQEKKSLSAMEQVNISRINSIEARESELKKLEIKLEERTRLAEQREVFIQEKMAEIARQEKKYQDLLEREKNLNLREQRIKQASGGN